MHVKDIDWTPFVEEFDKRYAKKPLITRGRRMPFCLFGAIKNGKDGPYPCVWHLNLAANHAQTEMIDYYVNAKRNILLKWWMPTSVDYNKAAEAASQGRAGVYMELPPGTWERLDAHCRAITGQMDAQVMHLANTNKAFEQKIKEQEEELAKYKKGKGEADEKRETRIRASKEDAVRSAKS